MEPIGFFATIFMGLSLGMIGGGGSILTVPILVYLFKVGPVLATAYSLFIVGLTALVGGVSYLRKGEVDLRTGLVFAIPSFFGVYISRAFILPQLPEVVFSTEQFLLTKPLLIMIVFALLMLAASFSMIRKKKNVGSEEKVRSSGQRFFLIAIEGLIVGGVTGFVGAGGGFLIIPALVILIGLPMKKAVGTSLFIIAAKSLLGFIGDLQRHVHIDWNLLFSISGVSIIGLFLGMSFSKAVSESTLKKAFGFFVLFMGSAIFIDQLLKLKSV